jgi:hypothetical protein
MLTRNQANAVGIILLVIVLAGVISLGLTILNTWSLRVSVEGFLVRWVRAWAIACLIGGPTAAAVMPRIKRLTDRLARG